ncbi:DNA primase/helicase [Xanthomonas phage BUDD]|nr:DNA primase/helicase [Xanthomonas phage BUDD]
MSDVTNERLVLSALVKNEEYMRKLIPFIKEEYFEDESEKRVFKMINAYAGKYNEMPDKSTLMVEAKNDRSLDEGRSNRVVETVGDVFSIVPSQNFDWLKEITEKWCQERAVYNALQEGIAVYQGENTKLSIAAIPDILAKAISVSFNTQVGQDYFDDAQLRWDFYTNPESKVPFRIDTFNEITSGGLTRKTLNLFVAGTNVGKSLALVSLAADYIRDGLNVLYVSCEMREEVVFQRVDANILGMDMNKITDIGQEKFLNRIDALKAKSYGKLKVKEFPPTSASTLNIRQTLDELKMKQNFIPDVIIVDYLQILASYRLPYSVGSYYFFKSVAEELRALAVETNTVVWSAAQFNRGQMNATDVDMSGIAESAGIAHTADGMWAMIRTDELDQVNQLLIKQLKSRYANKSIKTTFTIGVKIEHQTLFGLDDDRSSEFTQMDSKIVTDQTALKDKFQSTNSSGKFAGFEV